MNEKQEKLSGFSHNFPVMTGDVIHDIFENINDSVIITDKKGNVLFINRSALDLFKQNIENIREIGHLFNFDICILDTNQDILSYSPVTVILEDKINTVINTHYQLEGEKEREIRIISRYLKEDKYLILFLTDTSKDINQSYVELEKSNERLKEKIKENEELRAKAQSQAIRESLVNRISNAIRNSLEIDTILQTSVNELGKTLGADRTILLQYKPGEKELPVTHEYNPGAKKELKGSYISIEEDFFLQEVIETQEASTGSYTDKWDNGNKNKFKLIVPVIHHDELFGMIIMTRSHRNWHSEEVNLVQSTADQISVSIKNAQLFEETASKNIKISVLNEILKSINSFITPTTVELSNPPLKNAPTGTSERKRSLIDSLKTPSTLSMASSAPVLLS